MNGDNDETNVSFWRRVFIWKARTVNVYVKCCCKKNRTRAVISEVRTSGGFKAKGEIKEMKAEVGQYVDVTAAPVGGNGFEPGSEKFVFGAVGLDGSDASSQITESPVPGDESNPLRKRYQHDGGAECTATVLFRADGDRDIDEEAVLEASLVINFDEKNVTSVSLEGVAGTPETGGGTEPPAEPAEPEVTNPIA